ncbi:MAG: creatininase family protein [Candidatus Hadarchaeum sp.]|uniref:creatininase family protein n=1 Tax=Candidatus Hadarchaeum sp. TaxID=2883567 RepID=UPI003170E17C
MVEVKYLLEEMNVSEIKEIIKKCDIVLIPIGTVEQHGDHLPIFTDNYIAVEVSKMAAEKISKEFPVVVAPLVPFGKSTESKNWVGTISLEPITFIYLVKDICASLAKMGFKKLVFVNAHGGHVQLLGALTSDIARETNTFVAVFDWWQTDIQDDLKTGVRESGEAGIFHACEAETSQMMVLRPDLVNKERIAESYPCKFTESSGYKHLLIEKPHHLFSFSWNFEEMSQTGAVGDPTKASRDKGELIFEILSDALCSVLREIKEKVISSASA